MSMESPHKICMCVCVCVCVSGGIEIPPAQSEIAADTNRSSEPSRAGAPHTP